MEVRQTHIKQFASCARQYYYEHVLGLGEQQVGSLTVLGTVWHFSVEVYEQYGHDLDLAKRTFEYYWERPELLGVRIDFWHRQTTWEGLLSRGLSMLERYHELKPWDGGVLIGTEIQFSVPLGRHTLNGTIDKLLARPGRKVLEIIDFKTGSMVPEKLRYNIQFSAYCYATERPEFWEQVPGHEGDFAKYVTWERVGWWYHARNHRMYNAGHRGALDYQRLVLAVDEMERSIEAGIFPLDYSGSSCGYCPYVAEVCGSEVFDPRVLQ